MMMLIYDSGCSNVRVDAEYESAANWAFSLLVPGFAIAGLGSYLKNIDHDAIKIARSLQILGATAIISTIPSIGVVAQRAFCAVIL